MIFKSIRWRLQIWYGLILLTVLAGFGATAFHLQSERLWQRIDGELQRRANVLAGSLRGGNVRDRERERAAPERPPFEENDEPGIESPRGFGRPGNPRERLHRPPPELRLRPNQAALFDVEETNGFYFVVWMRDGNVLAQSTNAPAAISFPARRDRYGPQPPRFREQSREVVLRTPPGEIILVGRPIASEAVELRRVAIKLAGVGAVILILGLAGGWWLASRAIRPIHEISGTALKISAGDLSRRIDVRDTESELGQLASVLNATFARLENAFTQQQQFTSDAAHELRTPVSVMLTQTQTALNRERSAIEYRETLEACQRSAQRMRRLIESLLELARLDAGQETMKRSRFDLAQTAADCIGQIQPLAESRRIRIESDLAPAACNGDSERVAQVITNLLSNAVFYNRDNGEVRVRVRHDSNFAVIEVADNGPGIAPEHQANVFKRFYRADAARTASQGRSGLGLAISKAIVEAHGGAIELSSEAGRGTTFSVRLPAAE
jgi:heavy metal sensor kinase